MNENEKPNIFSGIKKFFKKILPGKFKHSTITEEDLRQALLDGEKSGVVESEERTMVEGVFYLGDRPVRAFMSHRSEILWLKIDSSAEEARKAIDELIDESSSYNSLNCFPLTASGDLDEIKGLVSVRAVIKALLGDNWPGLEAIMESPYFIPETMTALKAFEAFKKAKGMDLFVMDEYGGFAGLLTVQNLIEEIVGEMSGEAGDNEGIVKSEDGTYFLDGSLNIDEVIQIMELESLGEEQNEYHTLAGFILYLAGEIPALGSSYEYQNYRFTITEIDGNRIDKVKISKID